MPSTVVAAFLHYFGLGRDQIMQLTVRDYGACVDFIKRSQEGNS